MSWDEFDEHQPDDEHPGPGDDPAVQELEPQLESLLDANPERVFYETQLAILFKRDFFHCVTSRALKDLRESGKIGSNLAELSPGVPIRFCFSAVAATGDARLTNCVESSCLSPTKRLHALSACRANY
jgi:hypothetical protein